MKLAGYERLLASDYRLAFDAREERDHVYYVLSPKEIVVCKPCDIDDRINWLLKRNRFEEAMRATRQVSAISSVSRHTYQAVGERYLVHLVDNKEYHKAAELLPEVLGNNAELWKKWVCLVLVPCCCCFLFCFLFHDSDVHIHNVFFPHGQGF